MPHVSVKLYPGSSEEQKKRLARAIVEDVMAATGSGEESISVVIEELSPSEWKEKVYKPEMSTTEARSTSRRDTRCDRAAAHHRNP
jgi:4-oxalocrotonate tautomerase